MKNIYPEFYKLLCGLLLLLGQQAFAQTWTPTSPVTVCPGEMGTYTLSGIPSNYRFTSGVPPFVSGGTLLNAPTINSGSASFPSAMGRHAQRGQTDSII